MFLTFCKSELQFTCKMCSYKKKECSAQHHCTDIRCIKIRLNHSTTLMFSKIPILQKAILPYVRKLMNLPKFVLCIPVTLWCMIKGGAIKRGGKLEAKVFKFHQGGVYVGLQMLLLIRQLKKQSKAQGINIFKIWLIFDKNLAKCRGFSL